MDPNLQSRLLRVLEDGRVRRLGDTRDRVVDVRVVAATHSDLETAIHGGGFREDLYFRLAHLPIEVPPLRRREHDIRLLFDHFVEHYWRRHRMRPRHVHEGVYPLLEAYSWPGNVRELMALCERLVVFGADPITPSLLPQEYRLPAGGQESESNRDTILPLKEHKIRAERAHIERALELTTGNVSAAARLLDLRRTHLHQRMVALGVRRPGEP